MLKPDCSLIVVLDPGAHRKAKQHAAKVSKDDTVAAVAEEWFAHYRTQRKLANKPLVPATIEKTQWLLYLPEYREKENRVMCPIPRER